MEPEVDWVLENPTDITHCLAILETWWERKNGGWHFSCPLYSAHCTRRFYMCSLWFSKMPNLLFFQKHSLSWTQCYKLQLWWWDTKKTCAQLCLMIFPIGGDWCGAGRSTITLMDDCFLEALLLRNSKSSCGIAQDSGKPGLCFFLPSLWLRSDAISCVTNSLPWNKNQ